MQTRRIHIVMFVDKKMSLVRFNFRRSIVGLGLDIEDIELFFNLINKDT